MISNNRIPWIIAAVAMLFAMIVLVHNEISPSEQQFGPVVSQPVIQPGNIGGWRPSDNLTPTAPQAGDYSPWSQNQPPSAPNVLATPALTPVATPQPTPSPTPTPRPVHEFRGVVLDDNGTPVVNAHVRIVSGGLEKPAERAASTDNSGRFRIQNIPDDLLDQVIVERQGYSIAMMEKIPLPLPDELQIGMSALAGIDATVLDFPNGSAEPAPFSGEMQASLLRLKPADEVTTETMGISEPVLPVDTYVPINNQNVVVVDGMLQFDNVEPGTYRVAVKTGPKIAESESMLVKESGRSSTTLILGMKHTVKGTVVGGDTGQYLPQARVTLTPSRQPSVAPDFPDYLSFTDGQGEFVLPEVQPGRYWLMVGAAGYTTKTLENFTVQPGAPPEDTSVTLQKQQPLITVSVINSDGLPIKQAPLALMTMSGPTSKSHFGKTDEAGLFRFENLLPGRYSLSVTVPGDSGRQKTISIDLGDGEVRELLVRFGKPLAISGKVLQKGKPYKGLLSFVLRGAAIADRLVPADEKGEFTVDLEPGEYMVGTPQKPSTQLITIQDSPSQTLNLELQ